MFHYKINPIAVRSEGYVLKDPKTDAPRALSWLTSSPRGKLFIALMQILWFLHLPFFHSIEAPLCSWHSTSYNSVHWVQIFMRAKKSFEYSDMCEVFIIFRHLISILSNQCFERKRVPWFRFGRMCSPNYNFKASVEMHIGFMSNMILKSLSTDTFSVCNTTVDVLVQLVWENHFYFVQGMISLHSEQIYYKSGFKKVLPFHSLMLLYRNGVRLFELYAYQFEWQLSFWK